MILGLGSSEGEFSDGGAGGWRITSVRLSNSFYNKDTMFGSIDLFSGHPMAGKILDLAILKGFGSDKEKGYGHLDIIPSGRQ